MFKKLDISLDLDINKLKGPQQNSPVTFKEFSVIDRQYLFNTLSSKIQFKIPPLIVNISELEYPGTGPHTDTWQTSINIYLDTNNDETSFWKNINPNKQRTKGIGSFKLSDVEKIGSFVAQKGDCYLMDVSSIHSVKINNTNSTRRILRLGWFRFSVDEIFNSITILNN